MSKTITIYEFLERNKNILRGIGRCNMTWDELKQEAKKMGWNVFDNSFQKCQWIERVENRWCFVDDGTVMYKDAVVICDRTPDQMLAIMKALQ